MQPVNRGNPRLKLLFCPSTFDPYSQDPLLEPHVTLDGAGRLLDEYGNTIGKGFAALPLLSLAPTFANHPANRIANLFRHSA
jgi:hypothetical protein